jgi:RNA polymerase-binding transcription factor DksA
LGRVGVIAGGERGPALCEQALEAVPVELIGPERERAPLLWATTQNDLGAVLSRLGERESGTSRHEMSRFAQDGTSVCQFTATFKPAEAGQEPTKRCGVVVLGPFKSGRGCATLKEEVAIVKAKIVAQHLDAEERRWEQVRTALSGARLADEDEAEWVAELDRAGHHPADLASETTEREVDFGLLAEANLMLAEVVDARERLQVGAYGRCQTCGSMIPDDRLRAVPATRFCVGHERAMEPRWANGAVGHHGQLAPAGGELHTTSATRRMRS